jgi:metal-responsive CopG/Arc/MetJ family transcriptional regulator
MATVNFSVPDEVKETFDKTFGDQNKSAIIADLMRRAVREHQLQIRREQLFRQLTSARARRASATAEQISKVRASGRS